MEQEKEPHPEAQINLLIEPEGICQKFRYIKTARQLLQALGYAEERALVIRDGKLLTPDRKIWPGDAITIRPVGSIG